MELDIEKLRKDTPGCQYVLHFNNAGAALLPSSVIQAIKEHIDLEATMGGYEAAAAVQAKLENFYEVAAKLINCDREEIAFLDNATHAWDMAFYSFNFKKGDCILTSESEYASNYLAFLHQAKHTGLAVKVIRNDSYGQLDIEDLQQQMNDRVKLIAITHVPTQGGLINPAEEVGKIAQQFNIPYILDTTQSVGQLPIDVKKIGCDFLCATGRKYLRGPRGTGFLYAKKEILKKCDPPFIDLYSAKWNADNEYVLSQSAQRFESWEQNIAGKIGLSVAIQYALQLGIDAIWSRIKFLAENLRNELEKIPTIELRDLGKHKCGIVTFTCQNKSPQEIQQALAKKKINVSVSIQEYARLDMAKRHLPAVVRASVHYYNTEDEIKRLCDEVAKWGQA